MCPTHHRLVDRKENEAVYPVETLHEMKVAHEAKVLERLDIDENPSRLDIARKVVVLLADSRESWARYGPGSEVAKREPNNDEVYAVWKSERLSVIVPNNRMISGILNTSRSLFKSAEQEAISSFLIHARSYERWVQDEIPYSVVVRFPVEFETMIREVADAGA
jgi:hypothetical protein